MGIGRKEGVFLMYYLDSNVVIDATARKTANLLLPTEKSVSSLQKMES